MSFSTNPAPLTYSDVVSPAARPNIPEEGPNCSHGGRCVSGASDSHTHANSVGCGTNVAAQSKPDVFGETNRNAMVCANVRFVGAIQPMLTPEEVQDRISCFVELYKRPEVWGGVFDLTEIPVDSRLEILNSLFVVGTVFETLNRASVGCTITDSQNHVHNTKFVRMPVTSCRYRGNLVLVCKTKFETLHEFAKLDYI